MILKVRASARLNPGRQRFGKNARSGACLERACMASGYELAEADPHLESPFLYLLPETGITAGKLRNKSTSESSRPKT
jgi:hypothetical protein